jgi:hypothetical protein
MRGARSGGFDSTTRGRHQTPSRAQSNLRPRCYAILFDYDENPVIGTGLSWGGDDECAGYLNVNASTED